MKTIGGLAAIVVFLFAVDSFSHPGVATAELATKTVIYVPTINGPAVCDLAAGLAHAECRALAGIHRTTDGQTWNYETDCGKGGCAAWGDRWLFNHTPCSWQGVRCYNGHVIALDMSGMDIFADVPIADLLKLPLLESLDLSGNFLTGTIPTGIGSMAYLTYLDLSGNYYLEGSLPAELATLSGLRYLSVHSTRLSGAIPAAFGNLENLEMQGRNPWYSTDLCLPKELLAWANDRGLPLPDAGICAP